MKLEAPRCPNMNFPYLHYKEVLGPCSTQGHEEPVCQQSRQGRSDYRKNFLQSLGTAGAKRPGALARNEPKFLFIGLSLTKEAGVSALQVFFHM